MHYSQHPDSIRVDFFKNSGAWYCTEEVKWTGQWIGTTIIHREFANSLIAHLRISDSDGVRFRLMGMTAVCLEPYHESAFPLMVKVDDVIGGKYA